MDNERLLKLAGVQINEQQSETYVAAVNAVSAYLSEVMNRVNQDRAGDFGGSRQPKDVLDNIFKQLSRDVAVKYTQNT